MKSCETPVRISQPPENQSLLIAENLAKAAAAVVARGVDGPEAGRNGVGGRVVRADGSRPSQPIAFRPTREPDARRSRRHLGEARLGRRTRGAPERSSTRGRHAARTRNLPCRPIPG